MDYLNILTLRKATEDHSWYLNNANLLIGNNHSDLILNMRELWNTGYAEIAITRWK